MARGVAGAKLLVLLKASDHPPHGLYMRSSPLEGKKVNWGKSVL